MSTAVITLLGSIGLRNRTARRELFVAFASLLGCGALIAMSTNLAKVANGSGILPLPFLTWSLAGAALLLSAAAYIRGQRAPINRRTLEYFLLGALFTVAASNLIFFSAVAHVGVSFVILTIALPPVLTYLAALMLRMESFCTWRAVGVAFALGGASLLVLGKWSMPSANHFWIGLTLLGPVLLAVGNIYRTVRWPAGISSEALAPGMLFGAVVLLSLAALIVPEWSLALPAYNAQVLLLIAAQAIIFSGQFLLLFILQKAGGPVFLSLVGAVSAVLGVPIAQLLFAEPALPAILPSAILIGAGILSMVIGANACQPNHFRSQD